MAKAQQYSKAMVRAVKVLEGGLKEETRRQGFKNDDVVYIKIGKYHSAQDFAMVKIEGSIVEFLKSQK